VPNTAKFMLNRIADWGVKRIYGYPGDGINGLLGAFHEVGDRVEGEGGGDTVEGGGGTDLLRGGIGDDRLNGIGGELSARGDEIHCGDGDDTVAATSNDFVAADCERVQRLNP
jgi:Ca2+-binding RTX toxin-like protein